MKVQYQSDALIVLESALFRTTTSLILGEDYLLLVDPNWLPIELDFIEKLVHAHESGREKYLLFTHSDYDHIIGYGKFKHFKTIASENFTQNTSKAYILDQIAKFDDDYYIKRDYALEYPRIDIVISADKEKISIGSDEFTFFQARGHNQDGLFAYNHTNNILIAGDYLSNIEFPYIYDSVHEYMNTLSKFENVIKENSISRLVSGHGDSTSAKEEMITRIEDSRQYINQLVDSVTMNKVFNEKALLDTYDFPKIMRLFHLKNISIAEAEFQA